MALDFRSLDFDLFLSSSHLWSRAYHSSLERDTTVEFVQLFLVKIVEGEVIMMRHGAEVKEVLN